MNHQQAKEIIRETLQNAFDRERYICFVRNLLNNIQEEKAFKIHGQYVAEIFRSFINRYERIGTYIDPDGKKIDLLIVYLQKETTLDRARTSQRNFIARYLKDRGEKDAGLIAFVSPNSDDWRFSFVKMDYKLTETQKGGIKAIEEFTPAKRYSFLVGSHESSHTAQRSLLPILEDDERNPRLEDIEKVFNVEKVTKEFFEKYRELFFELKKTLDDLVRSDPAIAKDFNDKSISTVDFSKKLLGQIVFLYFLQKKGWFGVKKGKEWGEGSKCFLRELFEKKHSHYDNFFNDVLEPLFYEALRIEHPGDYYSSFKCRIPFLNGGLFDPLNDYNWQDTDIILPNELFSNQIKTPEGDTGTGIMDVFDRYNFTVNEDEPLEREVAVDPEMLGKVFENLLEIKDRKSKGTYYTPREIVHYMCQESLSNYLTTELEGRVTKEDIDTLIRYGETVVEQESRVEKTGKETATYYKKLPESIRKYAKAIDEKLATIRVCDPAVGSGAFPVGMMNEIARTRTALNPFFHEAERSVYSFKRDAIQNCLYGVDIDPGAVEIAKLRLWLSLIVDEEDIKKIKPLPNLDYKIVSGNSLLGVEKNLFNSHLFKQLEDLKPIFFNETNAKKKHEHKKQIDDLICQLTNGHKIFDFEVYFSEVFHEQDGFDVVIANPPYVGEKGHKEMFRELKEGPLGNYYQGKMDLFYFFFHLALNLGRNGANIAFITTNYYPTAMGARNLRHDFKKRAVIRNLYNFNELRIFESALGQHNIITILEKNYSKSALSQTCITRRTGVATPSVLDDIMNCHDSATDYFQVSQEELYDGDEYYIRLAGQSSLSSPSDSTLSILNKIKVKSALLGDLFNINSGADITISRITEKHLAVFKGNFCRNDGVFVISPRELRALHLTPAEGNIIKPFIKNSDIFKYGVIPSNSKLIYLRWEDNIEKYPNIKNHLIRFKEILQDQQKRYDENYPWFALHRPREQSIFESEKILVPYRSALNIFGYAKTPIYASRDVFYITPKRSPVSLKFALALLNSTLAFFWLYHRGKRKGDTLELYQKPLSEIPIKLVSEDKQTLFIEIIDRILSLTDSSDYLDNSQKRTAVKKHEKQIDQMVYELYSLSKEEIKIVEESK